MSDAERAWWLDTDRTWRRGTPPDGWRQGSDGRWHAPYHGPEHTTEEQLTVLAVPWTDPPEPPTQIMAAAPRHHLTTGRHVSERDRRARATDAAPHLPLLMKVAVPALVTVALLSAAGVLAAASKSDDDAPTPPSAELGAPADPTDPTDSAETGLPTSTAPATEAAPRDDPSASEQAPDDTTPVTTTAPSPTSSTTPPSGDQDPAAPGDPLAACSAGQRTMIERGNHPWDWYVARFDEDGDGILCN